MIRTFALGAAIFLAAAPVCAEGSRETGGLQPENPRRGYEGRYVLNTGCAVRWERAYDGYGAYLGERKAKVCD